MSYFSAYKRKQLRKGIDSNDSIKNSSIRNINLYFNNGLSYRKGFLLRNNLKKDIDYNITSKDDMKELLFRPNEDIKEGDEIHQSDGRIFLIKSANIDKLTPIGVSEECKNSITWKGLGTTIPCVFTNSSYGAKGEVFNNEWIGDFDARGKIEIQRNDKTNKIFEGMRLMLGSEHDVYEVSKIVGATAPGLWQITTKYTRRLQEDDIVNNIAYNPQLEEDLKPPDGGIFKISGNEYIPINKVETYTISPTANVTWEIYNNTNVEIVGNNIGSSVNIKASKGEDLIVLFAKNGQGEVVCQYTICTLL